MKLAQEFLDGGRIVIVYPDETVFMKKVGAILREHAFALRVCAQTDFVPDPRVRCSTGKLTCSEGGATSLFWWGRKLSFPDKAPGRVP